MLQLSLSVSDLASLRFAVSGVWEIVASIRVLKDPAGHALHLPWAKEASARLQSNEVDLALLSALVPVPTRVLPGFLAPTPDSPLPDIHAEIDALRDLTAAGVRAELTATFGTDLPRPLADLHADPEQHLPRLAEQMHHYWTLIVEPDWPRVRGVLEGDLMYRARRLADGGPRLLFADLDPTVSWSDGTLAIEHPSAADHTLDGRGLVLVPSAFTWPRVFVKVDDRWPTVVRYPCRAVGSLWNRSPIGTSDLGAVLGRSRARLLDELDTPASTNELARRTGLAAGGVSAHLAKLRAADLVSSVRAGRVVLYTRTARADALLHDAHRELSRSNA